MRWIKASEFTDRLHHRRQCGRIIRESHVDYYAQVFWDAVDKFWFIDAERKVDRPEFLEILDESTPASITDEAEKLYPYDPDNDEWYTDSMVTDLQRSAHITAARMYLSRLAEKDGEIEGLKAELRAIKEEHDFKNKPLM